MPAGPAPQFVAKRRISALYSDSYAFYSWRPVACKWKTVVFGEKGWTNKRWLSRDGKEPGKGRREAMQLAGRRIIRETSIAILDENYLIRSRPMELSRDAKVLAGIILLIVPTVQYGGLAILGMLTHGVAGTGGAEAALNAQQLALFRAGHAHAGVWLILSLVVQVLLDAARLPSSTKLLARIAAPVGTLGLSGGFFLLAFKNEFRFLVYFGALAMFCSLILAGVGLLRNLRPAGAAGALH